MDARIPIDPVASSHGCHQASASDDGLCVNPKAPACGAGDNSLNLSVPPRSICAGEYIYIASACAIDQACIALARLAPRPCELPMIVFDSPRP